MRMSTQDNCRVEISFPPRDTVRLDDTTIQRSHDQGRQLQQEIAKSSAGMFAPTPSESARTVR